MFGGFRAKPLWALAALLAPMALHQIANLLEVALGGRPARWFYPPIQPPHLAALVVFSLGEELGWRGFAYRRLARSRGPIAAALMVGFVWGLWHLMMMFTPEGGAPALAAVAHGTLELMLWSVVMAWFLEKNNRSLAIAIAMHAGAHLDNVNRAPEGEVRLRILRLAVVAVFAGLAARALRARHANATAVL